MQFYKENVLRVGVEMFNAVISVVKWSATLQGRPELPQWLHLMLSKHSQIAYLIGTPVTTANQVVVDIIVRNENNFQHAQKFLTIDLISNGTHDSSTKRIAEILIKNFDPEDFMHYPKGVALRNRLISAIQKFSKDNQTYLFNLLPDFTAPHEMLLTLGRKKFGTIVQIGTQNATFHSKIENLAKGIEINPQHCKRPGAYQNDFLPVFDIDWCKFTVKSITPLHSEIKVLEEVTPPEPNVSTTNNNTSVSTTEWIPFESNDNLSVTTRSSWDSFLMFPMLGVMCILFLILLSMVFFGRREGQYWRDYKTPKEQLEEYASVRESQRHLRDLSLHRQILEPPPFDRAHSTTPLGVHSFLQLLSTEQNGLVSKEMQTSITSSASQQQRYEDTLVIGHSSVGKQTVAEAAKACGSSLHMYRNPLDQESNEDEADIDETEIGSENPASPLKFHH
uniref:CADG domain-containing protein n=1 Tax=Syphacia muris TaxID=451379 RepID=A0A0N5ASU0_9BILA